MNKTISIHSRHYAAAAFAALCWGTSTTVSKGLIAGCDAIAFLSMQLSASSAFLVVVAIGLKSLSAPRLSELPAISLGILEPGLAYILYLLGLQLTTAGHAVLISALEPLGVLFLGVFLLQEKISRITVIGSVGATLGVAITELELLGEDNIATLLGDLFILAATLTASLYVVLQKKFGNNLAPIRVAVLHQVTGLALVLSFLLCRSIYLGPGQCFSGFSLGTVSAVLSVGILQNALPLVSFLYAAQKLQAKEASLSFNLIPLFGLSSSAIFLGEAFTAQQLLGLTVTLISIYLTMRYDQVA